MASITSASESNKAYYDPLFGLSAPHIGWTPPLRYLLRRDRILRIARTLPKGRLIEIGCGAGALLGDFSREGFTPVGLETSPPALAMSRALLDLDGNRAAVTDQADKSWNQSFDMACAFDVLEHVEKDQSALSDWLRWLKPGGALLISVPAHPDRWGYGDEWAGHWRRYDRTMLLDLVESVDCEIKHIECYGFPLANITEKLGERYYRKKLLERREGISRHLATAQSGIDRAAYSKIASIITSIPGRLALRAMLKIQAATGNTDLGAGYLALAQKR